MHCNLRVEGWRQEDPRGWLARQPTLIGKPHLPARGPSKQPRCREDPREWHYLDSDRNLQKNPSTVSLLWESCFHGSFGKTSTVGFSCTTLGNCQLNLLFFFFLSHSGTPEAPWERFHAKRGRNQCLLLSPQSPKVPRSSMPRCEGAECVSRQPTKTKLPASSAQIIT